MRDGVREAIVRWWKKLCTDMKKAMDEAMDDMLTKMTRKKKDE